jgi:hypothetical protein
VAFPLGLEELAACLGRLGLRTKIDVDRRRVAFLARLGDRDAPVIASATPDRRFVVLELRLPFPAAPEPSALAELNRRAAPCAWSDDPERAAVTVRLAAPLAGVGYTDEGVGALVRALLDEAERGAPALASRS